MNFNKYSAKESAALEELLFKATKEYKDGKKKDTKDITYPPYRKDFMAKVRDIPHVKKDGTPSAHIKMFPDNVRTERSLLTHLRHLIKKHKTLNGVELRLPAIQKPAVRTARPSTPTNDDLIKERGAKLKEIYGL